MSREYRLVLKDKSTGLVIVCYSFLTASPGIIFDTKRQFLDSRTYLYNERSYNLESICLLVVYMWDAGGFTYISIILATIQHPINLPYTINFTAFYSFSLSFWMPWESLMVLHAWTWLITQTNLSQVKTQASRRRTHACALIIHEIKR